MHLLRGGLDIYQSPAGILFRYQEAGRVIEFMIDWTGEVDRQGYDRFLAAPVGSLAIETPSVLLGTDG